MKRIAVRNDSFIVYETLPLHLTGLYLSKSNGTFSKVGFPSSINCIYADHCVRRTNNIVYLTIISQYYHPIHYDDIDIMFSCIVKFENRPHHILGKFCLLFFMQIFLVKLSALNCWIM